MIKQVNLGFIFIWQHEAIDHFHVITGAATDYCITVSQMDPSLRAEFQWVCLQEPVFQEILIFL